MGGHRVEIALAPGSNRVVVDGADLAGVVTELKLSALAGGVPELSLHMLVLDNHVVVEGSEVEFRLDCIGLSDKLKRALYDALKAEFEDG